MKCDIGIMTSPNVSIMHHNDSDVKGLAFL